LSSSNQTPSYVGIEPVSSCIGHGARGINSRGPEVREQELRELIFRVVAENPTWGAPRIHGELKMLGFDVSERTVSRWMQRAPRNPEPAKTVENLPEQPP
jgi:hypothetical protein